MTEFIGSRISLISKRDIRYVGTLHEISSENSTVALEQVVSFGTEGRRPDDEVPPSDNVYEYIVFRGSDVKDLRIEEGPKENNPPKPPVPDDPAILGSARRPVTAIVAQAAPTQTPQETQQQGPQKQTPQQRQQPPPQFQQHPQYPYPYPPPNQRFGPQGFPPGPGFPGIPYGAPPGWYPPPGYGYPHMPPGQFHPHQMPIGPPGQPPRQQPPQQAPSVPTGTVQADDGTKPETQANLELKPTATVKLPSSSTTPVPLSTLNDGPPLPTESKPDVAAALAPPTAVVSKATVTPSVAKGIPNGPRSGRIVPAVPLSSPNTKPHNIANGTLKAASGNAAKTGISQNQTQTTTSKLEAPTSKTIEEANRDARAAVAAAMAKLPPQKKLADGTGMVDNLTQKVNEMQTGDNGRPIRQPGNGGYPVGHRGGNGVNYRGGRRRSEQQGQKIEVPKTDYDFELANAKFNKQDLIKEAIATGSPVRTPVEESTTNGSTELSSVNGDRKGSESSATTGGAAYNKSSSFFDNISSESKDRNQEGGQKFGGREFRSEERQKNLETFGQGSVDNGYRGGYGRGGRGRGRGYGRGRGSYRGGNDSRGAKNGTRGSQAHVPTEG